jgi:hypothetical protein
MDEGVPMGSLVFFYKEIIRLTVELGSYRELMNLDVNTYSESYYKM